MMAFFLVMWLINAANEKTKAQVASYFNPVKLTDASTSKKGLNEPTKVTSTSDKAEKAAEPGRAKRGQKARLRRTKNSTRPNLRKRKYSRIPMEFWPSWQAQASDGAPSWPFSKGLGHSRNC